MNGKESQDRWHNANSVTSKDLTLPDGYEAMSAFAALGVGYLRTPAGEDSIVIHIVVADQIMTLSNAAPLRPMSSVTFLEDQPPLRTPGPTIPVLISASHPEPIGISLQLWCRRTREHYRDWQLATFVKLMRAQADARQEFERAMEAARGRERSFGTNPAANRALEHQELKRSCIATLVRKHFDGFGALIADDDGFPYPGRQSEQPVGRIPVARQRATALGMEEMIDWENMTYTLYPYYWADRSAWPGLFAATSEDPLHQSFLRAGAARVVVPLRVGPHEVAILLNLLSLVKGAPVDPDALTDMEWAYLDELRRRPSPNDSPAVEDEWEVRLPTSLVYLDSDAMIPLTVEP